MSSALPPGSTAPELRARAHGVLKARPELLEGLSAQQLRVSELGPEDAGDLAELQVGDGLEAYRSTHTYIYIHVYQHLLKYAYKAHLSPGHHKAHLVFSTCVFQLFEVSI